MCKDLRSCIKFTSSRIDSHYILFVIRTFFQKNGQSDGFSFQFLSQETGSDIKLLLERFSGRFMKCAINRKSVSFKNSDFLLASSKPLRILLTSKLFSTDEFFGEKRPSIKASFIQKLHPASCKNVFHKTLQYAT